MRAEKLRKVEASWMPINWWALSLCHGGAMSEGKLDVYSWLFVLASWSLSSIHSVPQWSPSLSLLLCKMGRNIRQGKVLTYVKIVCSCYLKKLQKDIRHGFTESHV